MRTSYFAVYRGDDAVGIALKTPEWYGPCKTYPDLFPEWSYIRRYKQDKNEDAYTKQYYQIVLSKLDPVKVYSDLKGKTLLCWERSGEFCHRRLVATWIELSLGIVVPEWTKQQYLF